MGVKHGGVIGGSEEWCPLWLPPCSWGSLCLPLCFGAMATVISSSQGRLWGLLHSPTAAAMAESVCAASAGLPPPSLLPLFLGWAVATQ